MKFLNILRHAFMISFYYSAILHPMQEESKKEGLSDIIYSISNLFPPYVESGNSLAKSHVIWQENNGLRPKLLTSSNLRTAIPEYFKDTPIPNDRYYSFWIHAATLYTLCCDHDDTIAKSTTQPHLLVPGFPWPLAVTIGHPESGNKWFQLEHIINILQRLNDQNYIIEPNMPPKVENPFGEDDGT